MPDGLAGGAVRAGCSIVRADVMVVLFGCEWRRGFKVWLGCRRLPYMIFSIIVAGFLSFTMSAIVSSTGCAPVFFHQCLVPRNSRAMSPALCRIGALHLLLFSKISPLLA